MDTRATQDDGTIKRLSLERETLRELTPAELRLAIGATAPDCDTGHAHRCHGTGKKHRC